MPERPHCFNLKIKASWHTFSKAFEIQKKTVLASKPTSNDLYIDLS